MDSLRHPVGTLPPSVYWRRRALVLVVVLAVLALILYACSDTPGKKNGSPPVTSTGTGTATASVGGGSLAGGTTAGGGTTGTPGSATGGSATNGGTTGGTTAGTTGGTTAGGNTTGGTTGGTAATGGTTAGTAGGTAATGGTTAGTTGGTTGSTTAGTTGGTTGGTAGGTSPAGSCQLALTLTQQAAAYANGDKPSFTIAVANKGTADCTVDVSGKSLAVTIFSGADRIWSSADCTDGPADPRAIAPGSFVQIPVNWNRTRSAPGCTGAATQAGIGTYYATAALAGATTSQAQSFQLKTGS